MPAYIRIHTSIHIRTIFAFVTVMTLLIHHTPLPPPTRTLSTNPGLPHVMHPPPHTHTQLHPAWQSEIMSQLQLRLRSSVWETREAAVSALSHLVSAADTLKAHILKSNLCRVFTWEIH